MPEYPTNGCLRPRPGVYSRTAGRQSPGMNRRVSRGEVLVVAGLVVASLLACKKDKKEESGGPNIQIGKGDKSEGVAVDTDKTKINIGKGEKGEGVSIETDKGKLNVGATEGNCKPGDTCACKGIGACEQTCTGKGCTFSCEGIGACDLNCPQGGCKATSTAMGATQLKCPGGDCTLECKSAGSCQLLDCKSGCKITCGGAGECTCKSGCS